MMGPTPPLFGQESIVRRNIGVLVLMLLAAGLVGMAAGMVIATP